MAIRNPLRIGLHVRRAVTQELVEPVFAAALDQMAVRPRASEEEQLAGDAGLVDSDDGLDGGAGVEPFPGAAAPEDSVLSLAVGCWPLAVGFRADSSANGQRPTANV